MGLIRSPQHRASATTKFFKACNWYENLNARPAGANYEKIKKFNNRAGNDEKWWAAWVDSDQSEWGLAGYFGRFDWLVLGDGPGGRQDYEFSGQDFLLFFLLL